VDLKENSHLVIKFKFNNFLTLPYLKYFGIFLIFHNFYKYLFIKNVLINNKFFTNLLKNFKYQK
jgi:hypothetical protein